MWLVDIALDKTTNNIRPFFWGWGGNKKIICLEMYRFIGEFMTFTCY